MNQDNPVEVKEETPTKFCKFCGQKIAQDAILCTHCGRQVEELKQQDTANPNIVINNSNMNANMNTNTNVNAMRCGRPKNKWVALSLCLILGYLGAHKFYEGRTGMGIIYLLTFGLFSIGVFIDFFAILLKQNPYYV